MSEERVYKAGEPFEFVKAFLTVGGADVIALAGTRGVIEAVLTDPNGKMYYAARIDGVSGTRYIADKDRAKIRGLANELAPAEAVSAADDAVALRAEVARKDAMLTKAASLLFECEQRIDSEWLLHKIEAWREQLEALDEEAQR